MTIITWTCEHQIIINKYFKATCQNGGGFFLNRKWHFWKSRKMWRVFPTFYWTEKRQRGCKRYVNGNKCRKLKVTFSFSLSHLLSLYFQSFAFSRSPEKVRTKFHASASLSSPTSRVPTTHRKSREIIRNKNRITRTAFNVHKDILSAIYRKKNKLFIYLN